MCRIIIDALILFPKAFSFSNIRFILNFASDPSMFLIASQLSVSHLHSSPFLSILLNPLFLSILLEKAEEHTKATIFISKTP
ncbi:hypothetical protein AAZX31_19G078400 [Glycine max]